LENLGLDLRSTSFPPDPDDVCAARVAIPPGRKEQEQGSQVRHVSRGFIDLRTCVNDFQS
jgi:hypothetical protein